MFFRMAEYCDTPQSKERRNWENKACLNESAILRLLDHKVTPKSGCFAAPEKGDFASILLLIYSFCLARTTDRHMKPVRLNCEPIARITLYCYNA
jgi:hypothetical protein